MDKLKMHTPNLTEAQLPKISGKKSEKYKIICDIGILFSFSVPHDKTLVSDSVATNVEQIFATYSPQTVRKVL